MKPVVLCIGDPNGIGPEIAVQTAIYAREHGYGLILSGDRFVIEYYAKGLGVDIPIVDAPWNGEIDPLAISVIPRNRDSFLDFNPGTISPSAGAATVRYVEEAYRWMTAGKANGILACPHSEEAVNAAGIAFSGYPSLIAQLSGVQVFLMLVGGGVRITHVTLHQALSDAINSLTPEIVCAAGEATIAALEAVGIRDGKLGVFGINPHAGEGGLFGRDDEEITKPAADWLRRSGIDVKGPFGADMMLAKNDCDAYLAMYHDQGHIPIKVLSPRSSVAFTIGATVLFASVGHGAAFDIAGKFLADPAAMINALNMINVARRAFKPDCAKG